MFREKHPMNYLLNLYGIWCKGKKGVCYRGTVFACAGCKYHNNKGCANINFKRRVTDGTANG